MKMKQYRETSVKVGTCKRYKPKEKNVKKLELFLKKIENNEYKNK
jgi:hypothetical protein